MIYSYLRIILYITQSILLCLQVYWIFVVVELKKRGRLAHALVLLVFNLIVMIILYVEQKIRFINAGNMVVNLPINISYVLTSWLLCFISTNFFLKDIRMKQQMILAHSIREGLDAMSAGLCFYEENGLPLLKNKVIESISYSIFNESVLNGIEFWDMLNTQMNLNGKRIPGEFPIIELRNGKTYIFSNKVLMIGDTPVYQILASDVTSLHDLSKKVEEDNKKLAEINIRLQEYSEKVADLTKEEEILNAKVKIHDDLGQSVIATKYYLSNPSISLNKEELLEMWKFNIALLRNEEENEVSQDALSFLYDAANAIGLKLDIKGSIQDWDKSSLRLFTIATRECMTNAIQHAKATTLFINIENRDYCHFIEFDNDGMPCQRYVEGGGLSGLRNQVIKAGGTMEIDTSEHFKIKIEIPSVRS